MGLNSLLVDSLDVAGNPLLEAGLPCTCAWSDGAFITDCDMMI